MSRLLEVQPHLSDPGDLALHGPRVLGFASASRIGARFGVDRAVVDEALLDFEARGWVQQSRFAGSSGWSLTETGRLENERRLSRELDDAGARDTVTAVHTEFVPLNRRFAKACTDWQIRPTRVDRLAFNDHTDWVWDERVMEVLGSIGIAVQGLDTRLTERLARFGGYADRYSSALARVDAGERRWVDAPEVDSCHTVWIQLHEDLLATLGRQRGSDT
jgi:hypothetical protein